MTFDLDMIRAHYERIPGRIEAARGATGKALTLAEKILYSHLWEGDASGACQRVADYDLIHEDDRFHFEDLDAFAPGEPLTIEVEHADGSKDTIVANHTYNAQQIDWFRAGSALNLIKQQQ